MSHFARRSLTQLAARQPLTLHKSGSFVQITPSHSPEGRSLSRVKFNLLDKIEHLDENRIVACKAVSLAEEYLADHFPKFPVLPGVMMLEAITQAAGWLMHHRTDFAKSMTVLKAARNIRYGTFVAPGNSLKVDVEFIKNTHSGAAFKCTSTVNDDAAISGRIEIAYFDLGDRAGLKDIDERLKEHARARWDVLRIHSTVLIGQSS